MASLIDQAEAALRHGRYADARIALDRALAAGLEPRSESEARSMLGLALVGLGLVDVALPELRAAVAAEPDEAIFRYNLGRGLSAAGDHAGAVVEHSAAVRLAPKMLPLVMALAQVQLAAGRSGDARALLEQRAADPHAPPMILRMLVKAQAGEGDTHAALDTAKRLVIRDLTQADAQGRADAMTAASLAQATMAYDEATGLLRGLLRRDPADAEAATLLAQLLLWTEGAEAAREALLAARLAGATSPRLLTELTDLGEPVAASAEELAAAPGISASDRADLLLGLARAADRAGESGRAWELATRAKALLVSASRRDWQAALERQLAIFRSTPSSLVEEAGPKHLYLLGTPRSGQSLVQSILAAAAGVATIGERGALLQHLLFRDAEIAAMTDTQRGSLLRELAAADRRGLERLVGTPEWVVDKSPLHLLVAGNVARVHPGARFAAVLRDPADVAVSIWLRRFPPVYDYANDFGAILDQLGLALEAISAWRREGLAIRVIDFENMLADPAKTSAELFHWLGLEWRHDYLDPGKRKHPVPTYSAAQVRLPVGEGRSEGALPYASQLASYADKLAELREKQAELFASDLSL